MDIHEDLLCISSAKEFAGQLGTGKAAWRTPESLIDAPAIDPASTVILDGSALGTRIISIARRLRWLGFEGKLLVAGKADSDLDASIAMELGVTDFTSESLRANNKRHEGTREKQPKSVHCRDIASA